MLIPWLSEPPFGLVLEFGHVPICWINTSDFLGHGKILLSLCIYNECMFYRTCVCPVKKEVASPLRLSVIVGAFLGQGVRR